MHEAMGGKQEEEVAKLLHQVAEEYKITVRIVLRAPHAMAVQDRASIKPRLLQCLRQRRCLLYWLFAYSQPVPGATCLVGKPQVEGLPELADAPKAKSAKAPKMKRIPSVPGIETDLSKAVRPLPPSILLDAGHATRASAR